MPYYGENLGTLGIETLPVSTGGRRPWEPSESTAREQFIADQGYRRTHIDPIINKGRRAQEIWEKGTGKTSPYPTINQTPGSFSTISPSWMEAGITNRNLGGYKVWQAGGLDWPLNPFGNKIDELKEYNEQLRKELDELRMSPANPEPGPWNEFYPGDVEYINDFLFEDEGGTEWSPSEEYLSGETEAAAIDPSDWRSIVKIIQAGGNPDDYIEKKANRGGLMSFV